MSLDEQTQAAIAHLRRVGMAAEVAIGLLAGASKEELADFSLSLGKELHRLADAVLVEWAQESSAHQDASALDQG